MIQRLGSTKTASYSPINLLSAGLPILRKVRPTGFERLVTARLTAHTERSTLHERLTPDTEYVRVHHVHHVHLSSLLPHAMIQMALQDQPAANHSMIIIRSRVALPDLLCMPHRTCCKVKIASSNTPYLSGKVHKTCAAAAEPSPETTLWL